MSRPPLPFPKHLQDQIGTYGPRDEDIHITLTFATSLDSNLSIAPGVQTALSGPESKALTHYLRSTHDALIVGVNTAIADDPSLNCRFEGATHHPRPVIIDPNGRWHFTASSKVMKLAESGEGQSPVIITRQKLEPNRLELLEKRGGMCLVVADVEEGKPYSHMPWDAIMRELRGLGLRRIMIEGGGSIINEWLQPKLLKSVDSVVVTIAPVWLGKGGVSVNPDGRVEDGNRVPVARLQNVKWVPLGEDVVLCGCPAKAG